MSLTEVSLNKMKKNGIAGPPLPALKHNRPRCPKRYRETDQTNQTQPKPKEDQQQHRRFIAIAEKKCGFHSRAQQHPIPTLPSIPPSFPIIPDPLIVHQTPQTYPQHMQAKPTAQLPRQTHTRPNMTNAGQSKRGHSKFNEGPRGVRLQFECTWAGAIV